MQTWDEYTSKAGLLIVLSGPSGVGKDAVLTAFKEHSPDVRRCVTITSRVPRECEVDGEDYHFVSVEEFHRLIGQGEFLEYAEVHGNLYGTPRGWVTQNLASGRDIILKIDVQGGLNVKCEMPECVMVFLVPPSLEELEGRLRSRLTETEEDLKKRLRNARLELAQLPNYEYVIENDVVDQAAQALKAVIIAEHCRIKQQD